MSKQKEIFSVFDSLFGKEISKLKEEISKMTPKEIEKAISAEGMICPIKKDTKK